MNHESSEPNLDRSSPPQSLYSRLGTRLWYGALAGIVFSSPGIDLTFDNLDPVLWLEGILSMIVLFGLPAGLILAWLDSRRGNKQAWQAIVKVPASFVVGSLLLFGIFSIPITIDLLSRWGSEAITGAVGNRVLRYAIGALAGAGFGLIILPVMTKMRQVSNWVYHKPSMVTEGQAQQLKE